MALNRSTSLRSLSSSGFGISGRNVSMKRLEQLLNEEVAILRDQEARAHPLGQPPCSELKVLQEGPLLCGERLHVECTLQKRDIGADKAASLMLVVLDLGAMQEQELKPLDVLRSRGTCERFFAYEPEVLRRSHKQRVMLKPEPQRFVDVDSAKEACLGLQIVRVGGLGGGLGPDMWTLIGEPCFLAVVTPRQSEVDFIQRFAGMDVELRGVVQDLSSLSPQPSRLNEVAQAIDTTLANCWNTLRESQSSDLPYSKGMGLFILHRADDEYIKNQPRARKGSVRYTMSGFPIYLLSHAFVQAFPEVTHMEENLLEPLETNYVSIFDFWRDYLTAVLGDLRETMTIAARQHDSELMQSLLIRRYMGRGVQVEANRITFEDSGRLKPGDEIIIGGEFHRVKELGSIVTCCRIDTADISVEKLDPALLIPASSASMGKTLNFIEAVELYEAEEEESSLQQVMENLGLPRLPENPDQRQTELVRLYTSDILYRDVNAAMYMDDAQRLQTYAPYIRALRDCFLVGPEEGQLLKPWQDGPVKRGANLPPDLIASYIQLTGTKQEIYWSSFTSTSDAQKGGNFTGNAHFTIHLTYTDWKKGQYFPANIAEYSEYKKENEVLLPPHSAFWIINAETREECTYFDLEPVGAPHVWDLIKTELWQDFKEWADRNPSLVDTRGKLKSIINEVADSLTHETEDNQDNPFNVCVKKGANVNETEPNTGETPLSTLAKKWAGDIQCKSSMDLLIHKGAHPKMGKTPLPEDYEVPEASGDENFTWMYWVEDGVDGKAVGWYPYASSAGQRVEQVFQEWLMYPSEDCSKVLAIPSDNFSYDVDFAQMQQTNTTSGKVRKIRRHRRELGEVLRLTSSCVNGYVWRKVDGGFRCAGGAHFVPLDKVELNPEVCFTD